MNPVYIIVVIDVLSNGTEFFWPYAHVQDYPDNRAECYAQLQSVIEDMARDSGPRYYVCMTEAEWDDLDPTKLNKKNSPPPVKLRSA
jgi:hypothetical protein